MLSHAPACGKIPRSARPSIREAGPEWEKFIRIWEAIESPESDLLIEDFAPFFAQFRLLQRLGIPFDACFIQRVEAIAHLCRLGEDDPDADGHDENLTDAESNSEDEPNFARLGQPSMYQRMAQFRSACTVANKQLMHRISLGLMKSMRSPIPPKPSRASRWDSGPGIRFDVVTGKPIGQKPAVGANLADFAPEFPDSSDRMALPAVIEPADRVRSKGGERTVIRGIPVDPISDRRREVRP